MRTFLWLIIAAWGLSGCALRGERAEEVQIFEHQGMERRYILDVPEKGAGVMPLLVVLHGGGGDAGRIRKAFAVDELAGAEGFMVLYPEALDRHWQDGRTDWEDYRHEIDDVGFIVSLVDDISRRYPVDTGRVYVMGFSNGGMMTQHLACKQTSRFAGFATIIAQMPAELEPLCAPNAPAPMMVVNGTGDPLMPYEGGAVVRDRGLVISTDGTIAFWRNHNGCSSVARSELFDVDPDDGIETVVMGFEEGCPKAPVVLVRVEGGGHTWPGGSGYFPRRLIGAPSHDVDTRQLVWEFFKDHRR